MHLQYNFAALPSQKFSALLFLTEMLINLSDFKRSHIGSRKPQKSNFQRTNYALFFSWNLCDFLVCLKVNFHFWNSLWNASGDALIISLTFNKVDFLVLKTELRRIHWKDTKSDKWLILWLLMLVSSRHKNVAVSTFFQKISLQKMNCHFYLTESGNLRARVRVLD